MIEILDWINCNPKTAIGIGIFIIVLVEAIIIPLKRK